MTTNVKRGTAPKTLADKRRDQVSDLLESRPVEAVSVAKSFFDEYPDDDDSLVLYLRASVGASLSGERGAIPEDLCNLAGRAAENRFFNPEIIALFVASKIVSGKRLLDEDIASLRRAYILDPRITVKTVEPACRGQSSRVCGAVEKAFKGSK